MYLIYVVYSSNWNSGSALDIKLQRIHFTRKKQFFETIRGTVTVLQCGLITYLFHEHMRYFLKKSKLSEQTETGLSSLYVDIIVIVYKYVLLYIGRKIKVRPFFFFF